MTTCLLAIGTDFRRAPITTREPIAQAWQNAIAELMGAGHAQAGVALLTCLRSELYLMADDTDSCARASIALAASWSRCDPAHLQAVIDVRLGETAAMHLFSVAAGLESATVGERQVLDQVRAAGTAARLADTTDAVLNRVFQQAHQAARRVRRETGLASPRASLADAAASRASRQLGGVAGRTVLLVGAGTVARATAAALARRGARRFLVTSPTPVRAEALAEKLRARGCHCTRLPWAALPEAVDRVDLIVSATAAAGHVITPNLVSPDRPLVILDLAVPRDVDPAIGRFAATTLIDLESLCHDLPSVNGQPPVAELTAARTIVKQESRRFAVWLAERQAVSDITALRSQSGLNPGRGERLHEATMALKRRARETASEPGQTPALVGSGRS
jgi:glutamyl-tRNA reductase